jgi:hypothetical protein
MSAFASDRGARYDRDAARSCWTNTKPVTNPARPARGRPLSYFSSLGQRQCILNVNAEGGLGTTKRVGAIILTAKAHRRNPFIDQARILPGTQMASMIDATGKAKSSTRLYARATRVGWIARLPSVRIGLASQSSAAQPWPGSESQRHLLTRQA